MPNDTDLNDDGRIDALDIARVRMSFATQDPAGDVNLDGRVNAIDIALVRFDAFKQGDPVGTPGWDAEEEICFAAINDYRAHPERWEQVLDAQGQKVAPDRSRVLEPLRRSYRLSQAAQWMAQHTADLNFLDHTDRSTPEGRDFGMRIRNWWDGAKYGYMGECGLGTDDDRDSGGYHSCVRWTLSPGHNGILLANYVSVGIGHAVAADGQHRWFADFVTLIDTAPWP